MKKKRAEKHCFSERQGTADEVDSILDIYHTNINEIKFIEYTL